MLRRTFIALTAALSTVAAFSSVAQAADTADGTVKGVVNEVTAAVRADKDMQAGNINKIMVLVEQKIIPNADFARTTQVAMGPNWNKASAEQKAQITKEFKTLLIRTYAGSVAQIKDQVVQFKPLRAAADDTEVVVRTLVQGKGDPIQLDYRMEKTANGWKVYDLNVMGSWLIETYKNQFNDQISKNGIDGLVKFLQTRNRDLAAGKKG